LREHRGPWLYDKRRSNGTWTAYLVYPSPIPNLGNCSNTIVESQVAHGELLIANLSTDQSTVESQICHKARRSCISYVSSHFLIFDNRKNFIWLSWVCQTNINDQNRCTKTYHFRRTNQRVLYPLLCSSERRYSVD
jgi:hypothetical protein